MPTIIELTRPGLDVLDASGVKALAAHDIFVIYGKKWGFTSQDYAEELDNYNRMHALYAQFKNGSIATRFDLANELEEVLDAFWDLPGHQQACTMFYT